MGTMYWPVCHDCRVQLKIGGWKLLEIRLNAPVAAAVGRFWTEHHDCNVELVPDFGPKCDAVKDYMVETASDDCFPWGKPPQPHAHPATDLVQSSEGTSGDGCEREAREHCPMIGTVDDDCPHDSCPCPAALAAAQRREA